MTTTATAAPAVANPTGNTTVSSLRWFLRTTPGKALRRMALVTVLAFVAASASVTVISHIRDSVTTIGVSTEPSIVASQKARVLISDLNAAILNDTLADGAASGTGKDSIADLRLLDDVLVDATTNVTFRDTEVPAIRGMLAGMQMFGQALGEARAIYHDDPWVGLQRIKWASRVLKDFVIPHADELAAANLQPLEAAYAEYTGHSTWLALQCVFTLGLLAAAIVNLQKFIARGAFLNWFVAAGLTVLAATGSWLGYAVIAERNLTVSAKTDAFDSINYLYQAKALAYEMNADETLWLVDPATRASSQRDFDANRQKLFGTVMPQTVMAQLHKALDAETAGRASEASKETPQNLPGLLGKEMDNVTFGLAERRPATDAIEWFGRYITIDVEIRRLEAAGDHAGAVRLCLGTGENQSNWAFAGMDAALDDAIKVNSDAFDAKIARALGMVGEAPWVALGGILLSLTLTLVGGARFYGEYR